MKNKEELTLAAIYNVSPEKDARTGLVKMYNRTIKKRPSELSIDDIAFLIRQERFLDLVLPMAVEELKKNPWAGEYWDGELLWSIAHLPAIPEQFRPEIASIASSMDPGKRELCDAELRGWSMTVKELKRHGLL